MFYPATVGVLLEGRREVPPLHSAAKVAADRLADGYVDGLAWHESEDAVDTKWVMQVWLRQAAWAVGSAVPIDRVKGARALKWLADPD